MSAPFNRHIILDFAITKYVDEQIHGFIGVLDPQNLRKDPNIIFLVHFLGELGKILYNGGHLGRHLKFHPFCLWSRLSTQVFFYLSRGILPGSRVKMRDIWLHTEPPPPTSGLPPTSNLWAWWLCSSVLGCVMRIGYSRCELLQRWMQA